MVLTIIKLNMKWYCRYADILVCAWFKFFIQSHLEHFAHIIMITILTAFVPPLYWYPRGGTLYMHNVTSISVSYCTWLVTQKSQTWTWTMTWCNIMHKTKNCTGSTAKKLKATWKHKNLITTTYLQSNKKICTYVQYTLIWNRNNSLKTKTTLRHANKCEAEIKVNFYHLRPDN